MKIQIDSAKTLNQIRKEFGSKFPFLKIEFFHKPHGKGKASQKKDMIEGNKKIKDFAGANTKGEITFNASTKVSDLEKAFQSKFGISVQVFRKSGDNWLETSKTDDWTLQQQNDLGKEKETRLEVNAMNYGLKD